MKKKLVIATLITVLIFQSLLTDHKVYGDTAPTHGDSESWVSEDMLKDNIPEGYQVNQATQGEAKDGLYEAFFSKENVQTISIEIDEDNLNFMFQQALGKPTVLASKVTIGDETVQYVGLKTKGNYTLLHSYTDNPQSDRFSLTINFGKYVKKKNYGETQNFYGVEKISLNNFFFDKSMLKEYCALMLMQEMELPSPQFGICKLYINGKYYGVYSMIESLDSTILERYYKCDSKDISDYLCKPTGTQFIYENLVRDWSPLWERDEDTQKQVEKMLPTVQDWVKKLNLLSDGKDFDGEKIDVNSQQYLDLLDQVIDTDEFLRYFAAHSFLCQLDDMFVTQQNFGLYVGEDGRALLIPWDYDLSFGTFSPLTSEATANFPLDQMFINENGTNAAAFEIQQFYRDYPLFNVIYQNEALVEKYHTYMGDCAKIMALGGTTSFGKSYEPALADRRIEALKTELIAAATEKTTNRAKYMNNISQPRDIKNALSNLTKIITMRSVGVYSKLNNITTHVSGKGCSLYQVGNGQDNWFMLDSGFITATDSATAIFTDAKYKGGTPSLTVKELGEVDSAYKEALQLTQYSGEGYFKVYSIKDTAASKVNGTYTLSIPLGTEYEKKNISFYTYEDGSLQELLGQWADGIFITETEKLGTLVIAEKPAAKNVGGIPVWIFGIGGIFLLLAVIFIVGKVIRAKRRH